MDSTNITPQVQPQFKPQGFSNPQGPNMPPNFTIPGMGGQFPMGNMNRQYPNSFMQPQPGMMPFPP